MFDSYHVKTPKWGFYKILRHVISRAMLLTPTMLKNTVRYLMLFASGPWVYISPLLVSYFTLAHVFSHSPSETGPHTMLVLDITWSGSALHITLRSTKTRSANIPPLVYILQALNSSLYCPMTWWIKYTPNSPAFPLLDASGIAASQVSTHVTGQHSRHRSALTSQVSTHVTDQHSRYT